MRKVRHSKYIFNVFLIDLMASAEAISRFISEIQLIEANLFAAKTLLSNVHNIVLRLSESLENDVEQYLPSLSRIEDVSEFCVEGKIIKVRRSWSNDIASKWPVAVFFFGGVSQKILSQSGNDIIALDGVSFIGLSQFVDMLAGNSPSSTSPEFWNVCDYFDSPSSQSLSSALFDNFEPLLDSLSNNDLQSLFRECKLQLEDEFKTSNSLMKALRRAETLARAWCPDSVDAIASKHGGMINSNQTFDDISTKNNLFENKFDVQESLSKSTIVLPSTSFSPTLALEKKKNQSSPSHSSQEKTLSMKPLLTSKNLLLYPFSSTFSLNDPVLLSALVSPDKRSGIELTSCIQSSSTNNEVQGKSGSEKSPVQPLERSNTAFEDMDIHIPSSSCLSHLDPFPSPLYNTISFKKLLPGSDNSSLNDSIDGEILSGTTTQIFAPKKSPLRSRLLTSSLENEYHSIESSRTNFVGEKVANNFGDTLNLLSCASRNKNTSCCLIQQPMSSSSNQKFVSQSNVSLSNASWDITSQVSEMPLKRTSLIQTQNLNNANSPLHASAINLRSTVSSSSSDEALSSLSFKLSSTNPLLHRNIIDSVCNLKRGDSSLGLDEIKARVQHTLSFGKVKN